MKIELSSKLGVTTSDWGFSHDRVRLRRGTFVNVGVSIHVCLFVVVRLELLVSKRTILFDNYGSLKLWNYVMWFLSPTSIAYTQ